MARVIRSVEELREVVAPPTQVVADKAIDHIDDASRRFLEASPFFLLATSAADGTCDVSPRGDPPGSVRVLDRRTLAFGDRKGNRRLDSLRNILANPRVGLLFLVPRVSDTLRVNGTARIVAEAGYLPEMARGGVVPHLAVEVVVEELFLHCSKAFGRSALWDHVTWHAKGEVPSAGEIVRSQHPAVTVPAAEIDAALEECAVLNRY